jgi:V/A-type H+-transporting ATPase subunit D
VSGPVHTPTRAAVLELKQEQTVVNEAYIFLDEKRLLLASELLRQLRDYQQLNKNIEILHTQAKAAMQSAVMFHGLDGLQVYPAASLEASVFKHSTRNFMGVTLVETMVETGLSAEDFKETGTTASNPSGIAEYCRKLFCEIIESSAVLAGISGNLYRLLREYRLTERRARALENVILPEIEQNLREMSLHLEELDLEDAVRVHLRSGSRSLSI